MGPEIFILAIPILLLVLLAVATLAGQSPSNDSHQATDETSPFSTVVDEEDFRGMESIDHPFYASVYSHDPSLDPMEGPDFS